MDALLGFLSREGRVSETCLNSNEDSESELSPARYVIGMNAFSGSFMVVGTPERSYPIVCLLFAGGIVYPPAAA